MKSITIHGIDPQMESLLKIKASNDGESLNKTIKKILSQYLGIQTKEQSQKAEEFMEFFGTWSDDEFNDFQHNIRDFDKIDSEGWEREIT